MRTRVAALFTALLTAAGMLAVSAPAQAQSPFPGTPGNTAAFNGYSTGTVLHADLLQLMGTTVVNPNVAFSGAAQDSTAATIGKGIANEFGESASDPIANKNSTGRGSGLEVGLGTSNPNVGTTGMDANQIILAGLAKAAAPPSSDLVVKQVGPVPAAQLLYADLLRGEAQALWNPSSCIIGNPAGYGLGRAAKAQLIDQGTPNATTGVLSQPTISLEAPPGDTNPQDNVSQSKSFTALTPNGDGTFGVTSETIQSIAPVSINLGGSILTIEIVGPLVFRATATGKGGSSVHVGPADKNTPTHLLITLTPPGGPTSVVLTSEDLFGPTKIPPIDIPPTGPPFLAQIHIGEDARAIGSDGLAGTPPAAVVTPTEASGANDLVRIKLLVADPTTHVSDIRIGHMEAKAVVPPGGIECPVPISKVAKDGPNGSGSTVTTVNSGQDFSFVISIPKDADALKGSGCDFRIDKVVDTVVTKSGGAKATFTSADKGGAVSGGGSTVTWNNLGTYHPGDPPILLTVNAHASGGAGVIEDTVTPTVTLVNCNAGPTNSELVQTFSFNGTALGGPFVLATSIGGPAVAPARLATTGGQPWIPVVGGGLLLGAMALWRGRRRLHPVKVKQ